MVLHGTFFAHCLVEDVFGAGAMSAFAGRRFRHEDPHVEGVPMDGITETAGEWLKKVLDDVQAPPEKCVRYRITNEGEQLKIDTQDPLDLAFEYGGRTVLIVDAVSAEAVAGRKLDFKDGNFCLV